MTLLQDIESVKNDITGVLTIGSQQVTLSQKEYLLFGMLRLILGSAGGGGGGGSGGTIDNNALAAAIANALELKTLTVAGDTVNEAVLAAAIAANTQPVSATALPLPTGAATSAKQPSFGAAGTPSTDVITVQGIASGTAQPISVASLPLPTGAATESTLNGLSAKLPSALVADRLKIDGSGVTQPVSAASLPLPTGAATETTLSGLSAKLPSALVSGRLSVDGSAVTQPISVASLPLPSGAATSAKQAALGTAGTPSTDVLSIQGVAGGVGVPATQSGTWSARLQDGSGNLVTSQVSGTQRALDAQILFSGSVVDPRSIRALTSADIISLVAISKRVSATFTRPADTTAYAAGDAMGSSTSSATILTFANSARASGATGIITKARLIKNSTTTTNAAFRLWLFSASPTGANDNAAFALSYASASSRLGYIDFPGFVTEGSGSDCTECEVIGLASQFYTAATSLFGVLVARAAYVPTSGEQFFVELALEQN